MGTGVHCAGCGKYFGTTTVAISEDWIPPKNGPDWPFSTDDCPVCASDCCHKTITVEDLDDVPLSVLREVIAKRKRCLTKQMKATG